MEIFKEFQIFGAKFNQAYLSLGINTNYDEECELLTCQFGASHMSQGCVKFSVNLKLVHDTILILFKVILPILFVCFCN
jgi:hypothetical protein